MTRWCHNHPPNEPPCREHTFGGNLYGECLIKEDMREEGEKFCTNCPDREACMSGYPCSIAREVGGGMCQMCSLGYHDKCSGEGCTHFDEVCGAAEKMDLYVMIEHLEERVRQLESRVSMQEAWTRPIG